MVTIITTARSTGNVEAGSFKVDMGDEIFMLQPNDTPFTLLSSKVGTRKLISPEFKWREDDLAPIWDTAGATMTTGDTTITVTATSYFTPGDIVEVTTTGEHLLVVTAGTTSFTCLRGFGTTSADTIANAAPLYIIGNAYMEGDTAASQRSVQKTIVIQYAQIFKTSFGYTGTEENSDQYGNMKDSAYIQKLKGIEHARKMEAAFWFGQLYKYSSYTNPERTMEGVNKLIGTNYDNISAGTITEAEFRAFVKSGFRYGSSTKYLFASALICDALDSWATAKLHLLSKDETYGIAAKEWVTTHGRLIVIEMKELFTGTKYGGYAAMIDMESVRRCYLQNRDTKLETNIQAAGTDARQDQYISEVSIQLANPEKHRLLTGVTDYS